MKIFIIIILLSIVGYSSDEALVGTELQRFLGNDFENQFVILENEYSSAIGDDLTTLELQFTPAGFEKLLSSLSKPETTILENGVEYSKNIRHGSGYDFFLLHASPPSTNVSIQYGHE